MTQMEEQEKETIDKHMPLVSIEYEKVKVSDGAEIEIIIQKPKSLSSTCAPAYIYAHGGGAIAFSARMENSGMSVTTVNLNCVTISVDYRLGPEYKCPRGQQDFVDVVCHVVANPTKYGIDTKRICLAGCSGGGWIAVGAMNLLIKANKAHLVKALFIYTGMLSDETANVPDDKLTEYERDWGQPPKAMTQMYKLLATDYDNQQQCEQLYPGRASDDILKKYPKTVIWTSEFDMYRRDNEAFAQKLQKCGRLGELSVMPSCMHGYMMHAFKSEYTQNF